MNKKSFLILVSTMFFSMLGFGVIIPLFPIYAEELGATGIEIGIVSGIFSLSHAVVLLFSGRLSDRYGRKIFMCIGLGAITLVCLGYIWAVSALQLMILRALQGIAATMHLPVAQAYLGDMTPEGEEGRWMGHFNAVLFAGMGAGPLFGGILNDLFGMKSAFFVTALLTMFGLIMTILFLPESEKKTAVTNKGLPFINLWNTGAIKAVLILQTTVGVGLAVIMTFLPIFAKNHLALSTTLIGLIFVSRTITSLLQSYTGRFSDMYNKKLLIFFGIATTTCFIAATPLASNFTVLLIFTTMAALGISFSYPAATSYVLEGGRIHGMGAAMSLFMLSMQIGNGVGPIIFGGVVDLFNVDYAFYGAALLQLTGLIAFMWLTRNYHGPQKDTIENNKFSRSK